MSKRKLLWRLFGGKVDGNGDVVLEDGDRLTVHQTLDERRAAAAALALRADGIAYETTTTLPYPMRLWAPGRTAPPVPPVFTITVDAAVAEVAADVIHRRFRNVPAALGLPGYPDPSSSFE